MKKTLSRDAEWFVKMRESIDVIIFIVPSTCSKIVVIPRKCDPRNCRKFINIETNVSDTIFSLSSISSWSFHEFAAFGRIVQLVMCQFIVPSLYEISRSLAVAASDTSLASRVSGRTDVQHSYSSSCAIVPTTTMPTIRSLTRTFANQTSETLTTGHSFRRDRYSFAITPVHISRISNRPISISSFITLRFR